MSVSHLSNYVFIKTGFFSKDLCNLQRIKELHFVTHNYLLMITNNNLFTELPNRLYFSVTSLLEHSVAQPTKYFFFQKTFDLSILEIKTFVLVLEVEMFFHM